MNTLNSHTYKTLSTSYHEYLHIIGHSINGAQVKYRYLLKFFIHLEREGITDVREVQPRHLRDYYEKIKTETSPRSGGPKNPKTLYHQMYSIELFYIMQQECGQIKTNPFSTLKFAYPKEYPPRTVLSQQEVKELYAACHNFTQRAILGLGYGCGLRVSEIVSLNVEDIKLREGILIVKKGKGNKRRVVPLSGKVKEYLTNYFYQERPVNLAPAETAFIFNKAGVRMKGYTYNRELKNLAESTENEAIKQKNISMHTLRHSIATHLLEQGMSLEQVREFLGHTEIETTQVYTHISQAQLNKLV